MPDIPQSELPVPKSWDEFEDIVADIYKHIRNDPRYGRRGQPQQGVGQPVRQDGVYVGTKSCDTIGLRTRFCTRAGMTTTLSG